MITRPFAVSVALIGLLLSLPTTLNAQDPLPAASNPAQPPAAPKPDNDEANADGIQALTRGPVHAAFAEPVSVEPAPGPVAPKQPPEPIEELPPEARPDDPNSEWIPGYWIWNEEENDFLWVSGIWRSPPSGMRWVPGHWTQVDGGFQRAGGFWTPVTNQEVQYLPNPPESVEAGPNVPAPSSDHFWVTGCWMWEGGRYQWRAGHWAQIQPDWLWSPAHYCWTPRGCVFVNGFWDYPLARRGVIFAPMHFHRDVYSRPGFVYTPSVIINVGFLTNHFFVRPNNQHYYFGDYYGEQYARSGYQPWFAFQKTRGWQDPIFVHQRWTNSRDGDNWAERLAANHRFFAEHADLRPRHTFVEQQRFSQQLADRNPADLPKNFIQQVALGTSVRDALSGEAKLGQSLQRVPDAQRRELRQRVTDMHDLAKQRGQSEAKADRPIAGATRPGAEGRDLGRFKLPALAGVPGQDNRPGRSADERSPAGDPNSPRDTARPGPVIPGVDQQNANRPNADRPGADPLEAPRRPDLTQPRPGAIGDRTPELPLTPGADTTRKPLPGAERQPDRLPGGTPGVGPSQSPTGPGTGRDRNDRTLPETERSRIPLPGAERQPDRLPGGTPGLGPSQSPTGQGTGANRVPPDRKDPPLPSSQPSRIPLPGAERQPSRIPGGTPGIGPSQSPTGQSPGANRSTPNRNDRTLPGAEGSRTPLPGAERQPARLPGGTPGIGPSPTPSRQAPSRTNADPKSTQPGVRRNDPPQSQKQPTPQPQINRTPEPSRSPQPGPTRVEAQRPVNPTPAPRAQPAPSGGGRTAAPAPGLSPGGAGGNRGAGGGNPGKGNDKK